ncbi:hypothetical protein [Chryseobacterium wangxinyae]|uniref:hypothetical protein n=1 Tax=Chryseobacterium sp. CY353 TaxID=2997334 RepID=UPI00226E95E4|nr:hypothetical protein [Chryseobacterium sp. CY353]MCY0967974.1 hypothetical protein [Chryseobacterium sp. CY353]
MKNYLKMKSILSISLLLLNICVFSQNKNTYVSDQIGWTVILPATFKTPGMQRVITKDYREEESKKEQAKETTEAKSNSKPITVFKDNHDNSLIVFVKEPKTLSDDLKKYLRDQHKTILNSFKVENPNIKYDEKTETETIDSISFIKSNLTLINGEITKYICLYTAEIKGYEVHIIAVLNNSSGDGKELLESLKNSKFHE